MPTYEYKCSGCENNFDIVRPVSGRNNVGLCPHCGSEKATRFYGSATSIMPDIDPYQSTITGEVISSRAKHRQHLKQHGCVEIGTDSMERAQTFFNKPRPTSRREYAEAVKQAIDHHQ